MKKIIIGIIALTSLSAFAGSRDCKFEAETKCMNTARKEIRNTNSISVKLTFQARNSKGGFDNRYACTASEIDIVSGIRTDLAEYSVKTSEDIGGWCEVQSIKRIDNL